MPELVPTNLYRIEEVRSFVDDVGIIRSHQNDYGWQVRPGDFGRSDSKIVLEYRVIDFQVLKMEIQSIYDSFKNNPDEMNRVDKIVNLLKGGAVAFPLLVIKGNKGHLHPKCKIREGMHRGIAHLLLGSNVLPVFVMRYCDDLEQFDI